MTSVTTDVILLLVLIGSTNGYGPWDYNGTTPLLENIIIGRCSVYQSINPGNRKPSLSVNLNCTEIWKTFKTVFAYKDSCHTDITEFNYTDLIKKIDNGKKVYGQAMFWSGTKVIAHDFTHVNDQYETLEDTIPGYLANNLRWCGCKDCMSGINYQYCNKSCTDPVKPYWDLASQNFAEKAADTVYVMLNGTAKGINTAYYRESVFGRIELPTLGRQKQITNLIGLVIFDVDKEPKEKCGEKSLDLFVKDAKRNGIQSVSCIDNPSFVKSILCAKYPHADQCKKSHIWKDVSIATITTSSLFLIIIIILIYILASRRKGAPINYKNERFT